MLTQVLVNDRLTAQYFLIVVDCQNLFGLLKIRPVPCQKAGLKFLLSRGRKMNLRNPLCVGNETCGQGSTHDRCDQKSKKWVQVFQKNHLCPPNF